MDQPEVSADVEQFESRKKMKEFIAENFDDWSDVIVDASSESFTKQFDKNYNKGLKRATGC